jgi:outer membrane protein OmpA-like peptidoglycan-associated protein/opacity protein-like surface antigen
MISKISIKKVPFLALFLIFSLTAFSQTKPQDYADIKAFSGSSPFRKLSVGINAGVLDPSLIIGGSNDFLNPQFTLGFGANIHYQLNHYIGFQADYLGGSLKGNQDKKPGNGGLPPQPKPVSAFKTNFQYAGSVSAVFTFGNINWLHTKNYVVPYISVGAGYMGFNVKIIPTGSTDYETYSAHQPITQFFVPVAAGLKIDLSTRLNLDLGYRMHFVDGDNLDGSPWYRTTPDISSTVHKDKFGYAFAGLDISLGKKNKPKMIFDNPAARVNNALQNQIDTLKDNQKKLMTDSDGDGVPDMFDKEPNTPAGCPVDSHGVSRDTDGDGVPDCKDKELITPTECQPVDANGVGKCPEPDCCKAIRDSLSTLMLAPACDLNLPSITFKKNRSTLSNVSKAMLAGVASRLKNSPSCSIIITGYPAASKASQAICNKRNEEIKNYLVESQGISADRIEVNCEVAGGEINTVDIKSK